jgi:uridine phosphorylase
VAEGTVPEVCLLDPDGDVASYVESTGAGFKSSVWACYHTCLYEATTSFGKLGIVPFAVGAPFAVLVAEELFASGCKFLISLSSAGRISPDIPQSCYVVIDEALRGEGTSLAYVPGRPSILADQVLAGSAYQKLLAEKIPVVRGTSWTTDAPFRETERAIALAACQGAIAVEMEAAGLYAFAQATGATVLCLAHLTNDMAVEPGDFEKGASNGAEQALRIVEIIDRAWIRGNPGPGRSS